MPLRCILLYYQLRSTGVLSTVSHTYSVPTCARIGCTTTRQARHNPTNEEVLSNVLSAESCCPVDERSSSSTVPTKRQLQQKNRKRKRGAAPQEKISVGARVFAQYSAWGYFWGNVIDVQQIQPPEGNSYYRIGVWFDDDDVSVNCTLQHRRLILACIVDRPHLTLFGVVCIVKRDTLYTANEFVSAFFSSQLEIRYARATMTMTCSYSVFIQHYSVRSSAKSHRSPHRIAPRFSSRRRA